MDEQRITMDRLNDFLKRRGLRANYVARQVGIGERTLYCFKSGSRLLTKTQLRKLQSYIFDYEQRMSDADEKRDEESNETAI